MENTLNGKKHLKNCICQFIVAQHEKICISVLDGFEEAKKTFSRCCPFNGAKPSAKHTGSLFFHHTLFLSFYYF